jgi:hypothetical protein
LRDRLLLSGWVKVIGNAIDDTIDTSRVLKTVHGPCPVADLSEGSFYGVGSVNLTPIGFRAVKEAQ